MKYKKAMAIIIDLGEEDIITASSGTNPASDCNNSGSRRAANCTSTTYVAYQTCASNALWHHS